MALRFITKLGVLSIVSVKAGGTGIAAAAGGDAKGAGGSAGIDQISSYSITQSNTINKSERGGKIIAAGAKIEELTRFALDTS